MYTSTPRNAGVPSQITTPEVEREMREILRTLLRIRRTRQASPRSTTESPTGDARVRLARRYIERNAYRNLTLDEIADEVHLSKYHLIRMFKRFEAMTPLTFRQQFWASDNPN